MSDQGYYLYPTVNKNLIVFVSDDDLWSVNLEGGKATRLSTGLIQASSPVFSPDGSKIAFTANHEGQSELYVMPRDGGEYKRLTYLGDQVRVYAWVGDEIYFGSSSGQPFLRVNVLFKIKAEGGTPTPLNLGPVNFASVNQKTGALVLQRHGYREYGFWKRYRGGTRGEVWIDALGQNQFKKLIDLDADMARPLWIGDRIYFVSDHEGFGNIYSCTTAGSDLKRHTHHEDYYVRNPMTDGEHIVYHAGGDLYRHTIKSDLVLKVEIAFHASRVQKEAKFTSAKRYLESYNLHPQGQHMAVVARGKTFVMGNFEGAVTACDYLNEGRYVHARWFHDGKRLLLSSDVSGEEALEIYDAVKYKVISKSPPLKLGRILTLEISPTSDAAFVTNNRHELIYVNLKTWKITVFDRSLYAKIYGASWSPDGAWIAYSSSHSRVTSVIKIVNVKSKKIEIVTKPLLRDVDPVFDPDGKYLYFLSYREFDPAWDSLHFELGFPKGMKPYLLTLEADQFSPFLKDAKSLTLENSEDETKEESKKGKKAQKEHKRVKIDFEGITDRVLAFPLANGLYDNLQAISGKLYYLTHQIQTSFESGEEHENETGAMLEVFDFESLKSEVVSHQVHSYEIAQCGKMIAVENTTHNIKVHKIDDKSEDEEGYGHHSKNLWIDLGRIRLKVDPKIEWVQLYKEAWRLQRDHFWTEDMSMVDWKIVYDRYFKLLDRVSTRAELNDLLWEMQGELGTSHAYVFGGDIKKGQTYYMGKLGARFTCHTKWNAYIIEDLAKGDIWNPKHSSPLLQPGINVTEGDLLWRINGVELTKNVSPEEILVNYADEVVRLTVSNQKKQKMRDVIVKTLNSDLMARYRDWVEANRSYIHAKTKGKVGYIHIPDMSSWGFSEFHRYYLDECEREGLIVDVRYNGGGAVSPLLLEKLARRRLGYDVSRWGGIIPYPEHSPMGPMVALSNEYAGSDGDVFCHAFRMMKLGPLIGKRTWGGVIGYSPTDALIDGGMTTQPEFSFWFKDIGWSVENYGVDPDIEVEYTPEDYLEKKDPQIDRGLKEVLKIMASTPHEAYPIMKDKPNLALPKRLKSKG
jgi:tricorn protease